MASLKGKYDKDAEQSSGFDIMPASWQPMAITESAMVKTKKKEGQSESDRGEMLELTLEVAKGKYKGRKVWERLNLVNKSEVAVKIANEALSGIRHATGVLTPKDSTQLHGKIMICRVGIDEDETGQYDDKNKILRYLSPKAYKELMAEKSDDDDESGETEDEHLRDFETEEETTTTASDVDTDTDSDDDDDDLAAWDME